MGGAGSQFSERYTQLMDTLPLSTYQKDIMKARYISIVTDAEADHRMALTAHYVLVCIVSVSGVVIGSLLVLDRFFVNSLVLFWITWGIAMIIALCNKLLYSFNISKKYILNSIVLGKLYGEYWMFLTGGGKYKKYADLDKRFEFFCERVEKIKLKSIESASEMDFVDTPGYIFAGSPRPQTAPQNTVSEETRVDMDNIQ